MLGDVNRLGSEMNDVSMNRLTRKQIVTHNSTKLHSIHAHHVMNMMH